MKVSQENIENRQVVLTIDVESPEMERSLEDAYQRLVKRASVPGFRKGKTPRAILERHIGRGTFLEEAVEHLLPQVYNQAIKEQGIEAIAEPKVEITRFDPLSFKATIALRPTVELYDYHHIRLAPESVNVTEDDIGRALEQLRYQNALWKPVERPAQIEDLVTVDVDSSVDGKAFLKQQGLQYYLVQESTFPVPGFAQELVGMEKGIEKEFKSSFPPEHPVSNFAGKNYYFKVLVSEVKERKLPELDDEFAKTIGEGIETLEQLRERAATNLRAGAEERVKRLFEEKVVDAVVDVAKLDFPLVLVEEEINHILDDQATYFGGGQRGLTNYLRSIGKTAEEARKELDPIARKRVARSLVLSKVAEAEGIKVTSAEIDSEIETIAKNAADGAEERRRLFNTPPGRASIERLLLTRKTLQHLVQIASSEDTAKPEG